MAKTISLNSGRVLKLAGLLVLAAMAIAFFAFPMVSFAKPNMATVTFDNGQDKAFILSADGTSNQDTNFDPQTTTAPADGSLEVVQVTPKGGQQVLAVFLGNSKIEVIQNGRSTPAKIK